MLYNKYVLTDMLTYDDGYFINFDFKLLYSFHIV